MRSRILVLVAAAAACLGGALVAVPTAHASPLPPIGTEWASCGGSPTANYCVLNASRNSDPIPSSGERWRPWVDRIGPGDIRYGVYHEYSDGSGFHQDADVPVGDTYSLTVRTGTIHPRELYGNVRNVDFSIGTDSTGWTFTITFQPTPLHHVGYNGDTRTCTIDGGCGDSTWEASLDYDGFVTGYVTDLDSSGLSSSEIGWRTGMIRAYNAQDESTYYDPDLDSLVIKLANPHLTGTGAVATGSYQMYFPNAYLINVMGVPDPASLTSGSLTVTRSAYDSSGPVPFTVTHDSGGVQVSIAGITYSRPTYKIKPKPTVPGKPRLTSVVKLTGGRAKLSFKAPLANGGRSVDRYSARCRKYTTSSWHSAAGSSGPLVVSGLPSGKVYCQVRAHNSIGWGPFGSLWGSR
jgi:hypothetical protein